MEKLIYLVEENVLLMKRLENLTVYDGNRFHLTITWEQDGPNMHGVILGTIKVDSPQISVDLIDGLMKTAAQYLYDNNIDPTDNITFSVSRIYIMFGHNKIDLFDYIPHNLKRDLIGDTPTIKEVVDGHYGNINPDQLPDFNSEYDKHVAVKIKRLQAVFKVLQRGTFEGEPYRLKSHPEIVVNSDDKNFTVGGRVVSPDFKLSITGEIESGPQSVEFRNFLREKFKNLGITDSNFI
jgi:hypothetical protein